jgi:hypothetical protein
MIVSLILILPHNDSVTAIGKPYLEEDFANNHKVRLFCFEGFFKVLLLLLLVVSACACAICLLIWHI